MNAYQWLALVLFGLVSMACDDGASGTGDDSPTDGDFVCPEGYDCPPCDSDEDCPEGMSCDEALGYCLPSDLPGGCSSDEDCFGNYTCNLETGLCEPPSSDDDDDTSDGDLDGDEDGDAEEQEQTQRCEDDFFCTDDSWNGSECVYELRTGYCLINNACISEGTSKPDSACMACRPTVNAEDWSNAEDGASCDDGLVCTEDDACQSGSCQGETVTCDDSVDCTEDRCEEPLGCQFEPKDELCAANEYCDLTNGCTDGGCMQNAVRCVDGVFQRCNASGSWEDEQSCLDPTPVCTADGCQECVNGVERCEGRTRVYCENGSWVEEECLGPDPACQSGECQSCTNGDLYCDEVNGDYRIYECRNGAWVLDEDCEGDTPMCGDLQDGNGIVCLECAPGETRCDGLSHQICESDGHWTLDPCSGAKPFCENGECVTCLLGSTRCGMVSQSENANDVYLCVAEDLGGGVTEHIWQYNAACPPEAPNCTDGLCESCNEGDTRCAKDPGETEICDENGLWVDGPDCPEGSVCDVETGECAGNYSLEFGGDDFMVIPDENDYDPNAEFTLEAWIFPTSLSGNCDTNANTILEKWDAWPQGIYLLVVCADFYDRPNVARFMAIADQDHQDYLHSSNNSIHIGEWNHVAVVWADDAIDLYVNGVLENHHTNLIGWRRPGDFTQNHLVVGSMDKADGTHRPGWGFNGYIDEVRISKIRRYEGDTYTPQTGYTSDLFTTGLWHFDDIDNEDLCIDASDHHDGDNTHGATYSDVGVGEQP